MDHGERRGFLVIGVIMILAMVGVFFPELPPQALYGLMWMGAGILMIVCPPQVRLPRMWWLASAGFILAASAGFLPGRWFDLPQWRSELESLGVEMGSHAYVQPRMAGEGLVSFAVTLLTGLYLFGHRVMGTAHLRLAWIFTVGVVCWNLYAMAVHRPGEDFGFFPNRNHTATLLSMGVFTATACLYQELKDKRPWRAAFPAVAIALCVYSLLVISVSRAGVVLLGVGLVAWIPGAGIGGFGRNSRIALGLLFLVVAGIFVTTDSHVKSRVLQSLGAGEPAPEEGRLPIYKDTWTMIGTEPWTGVGPGQFVRVFPQYRQSLRVSDEVECLHPESDWLMVISETGLISAGCLLAGLVMVVWTVIKGLGNGRSRKLRAGTLVAAVLLPVHGVFDVPAHKPGLAWAALVLLACSLRPSEGCRSVARVSKVGSRVWQVAGVMLVACALVLLQAQWRNQPVLAEDVAKKNMELAAGLYRTDQAIYDREVAEAGRAQVPHDFTFLERAIEKAQEATRTTPLAPHPYFLLGTLQLHIRGREGEAATAFAIQRKLLPDRVSIRVQQAHAWSTSDLKGVEVLWKDAMAKAQADQIRFPYTQTDVPRTYEVIVKNCGESEELLFAAASLAENDELARIWMRHADPVRRDRTAVRVVNESNDAIVRDRWLAAWRSRLGSKAVEDRLRMVPKNSDR